MTRTIKRLLGGVVVSLAFYVSQVQGATSDFSIAYCSSENTASGAANYWVWQSNGWCHDKCVGTSAFAVVQDTNCWCSDYIPADQTNTGDCDENCPGFPDEKCGSKDQGLFGYIALSKQPSGTQGGSQASATKSSSGSRATTLKTTLSTSAPTSTGGTATPITDIQTKTISGIIVTMTVVTTTEPSPALSHRQNGANIGAIVGGVLGGLLLLVLLALVAFFLLRRRRQQEEVGGQSGVQRNTSTMSRSGLLAGEKLPPIVTNVKRNSRYGLDHDSISPVSGSDRRLSRPYLYDQRLNPSAMMTLDNVSRASVISLDDGRDYGRTLNVTNPDPEPPEPTHHHP